MPTFITLVSWTDEGIGAVEDTVARYEDFTSVLEKAGVREVGFYWTTGDYDAISIVDAPDQETASAVSLKVASQGTVRTKTIRAYTADEMQSVLDKMP